MSWEADLARLGGNQTNGSSSSQRFLGIYSKKSAKNAYNIIDDINIACVSISSSEGLWFQRTGFEFITTTVDIKRVR